MHTMPFLQFKQCRLCMQCHLCNTHNAHCACNAICFVIQCQICIQCPLCKPYNAKCANNAISATYSMPIMHTMPFVHTMPFLPRIQCQMCTQCHLCSIFGIGWLHIWHWMVAYLALTDCKLVYNQTMPFTMPIVQQCQMCALFLPPTTSLCQDQKWHCMDCINVIVRIIGIV